MNGNQLGGIGSGNPGVKGVGSLREAGEQRLCKVAELGEIGNLSATLHNILHRKREVQTPLSTPPLDQLGELE